MKEYGRRARDREGRARRAPPRRWVGRLRYPGWHEQFLQFLTRYLFEILAMAFFLWPGIPEPLWLPAWVMGGLLLGHGVINTLVLLHARHVPFSLSRYRLAMAVDIIVVGVCVANDPYPVPPSLLAFIMIVLGNGMRYGMPLYTEALGGSFLAALGALWLNHLGHQPMDRAVLFLSVFAAIILLYAFVLLHRIEQARDRLERRSQRDTLTGLLNRRALEDAARIVFEGSPGTEPEPYAAVLFADLDRFKQVNDVHGHATGDRVLREIAGIIRARVRADDIVGRYGGDEFVVLLPGATREAGAEVADRIQCAVSEWGVASEHGCSMTFGVAGFPEHGNGLDELLHVVDHALYRAKKTDRRGVVEVVAERAVGVPRPFVERAEVEA